MSPLHLYTDNCPALPRRVPLPRPIAAAPNLVTAQLDQVAAPAPKPPSARCTFVPSATLDEHITRVGDWYSKQDEFQGQDTLSIHHRENLDERAALIRTRLESMHHELIEMHSEYMSLQEQDDSNEEKRDLEYEALCTDACAMGQPLPLAPRSVGRYYDTSLPLRNAAGKLKHKLHMQRGDRVPDWLTTLSAVVALTATAWSELVNGSETPEAPNERVECRRAIDAVKAVAHLVRAEWCPQYNLCTDVDGLVETPEEDVVGGLVEFDYADRYGKSWRAYLSEHAASEDARAPLTGPRVNGRLNFEASVPDEPPCEYTDLGCESALDSWAVEYLTPEQIKAHTEARGSHYAKAISRRWMRERSDKPLIEARLKDMIHTRVFCV